MKIETEFHNFDEETLTAICNICGIDKFQEAVGRHMMWCRGKYPKLTISAAYRANANYKPAIPDVELACRYCNADGTIDYFIMAVWDHRGDRFTFHS